MKMENFIFYEKWENFISRPAFSRVVNKPRKGFLSPHPPPQLKPRTNSTIYININMLRPPLHGGGGGGVSHQIPDHQSWDSLFDFLCVL